MKDLVIGVYLRLLVHEWQLEDGMSTAEYAIGTIAAASFAGILIAVVKSGGIKSALEHIIQQALTIH